MSYLARATESFPYYGIKAGQLRACEEASNLFCEVRVTKPYAYWTVMLKSCFEPVAKK